MLTPHIHIYIFTIFTVALILTQFPPYNRLLFVELFPYLYKNHPTIQHTFFLMINPTYFTLNFWPFHWISTPIRHQENEKPHFNYINVNVNLMYNPIFRRSKKINHSKSNKQEMDDEVIEIEQEQEQEEKDDDAEKQQQKKPPRKVTKIRGGQKRDYIFLQSVKSVDELDNLRFKNYCIMGPRKQLPIFKSRTMPCTRGYWHKQEYQCDFELLAVRRKSKNGSIDVYAHGDHNHPFMPEEKRAIIGRGRGRAQELMPVDENPPRIYRTADNAEWTFLRTFADYDQMQKFRFKSHCRLRGRGKESRKRIRFPCNRRRSKSNCEFWLLALKTTFASYHVYTFGEHNHAAIKPNKKPEEMEVDEEDDDEDDQEENETDEEEEENEGEEDDEIIVIDDEEDIIEVEQPHQEEKRQGPKGKTTGTSLGNEAIPRVETAKEKLAKANANIYKWMAGIEPTQIGPTLGDWDNASLLRMVEMADQEIRLHPEKFDLWRPWLKCAMKKCMQIENVIKEKLIIQKATQEMEDEDEVIEIEQEQGKDDDAEKQKQRQPPRKVTKIRGGQKRDYIFLKTIKSVDELDDLRFKNYCIIENRRKTLPTFTTLFIPCTRKIRFKSGKQCDFELMAQRQKNGTIIDVYAYSKHNHPMMPEEKRASIRGAKELMPAENPPRIFQTEDNIEWKFVQSLPDYGQLLKFLRKSQCRFRTERENHWRVRLPCNRRKSHNCKFTLLALKTTKKGYHVYTFGKHQHNHPVIKPKKKQQTAARSRQQEQPAEKEMEVDEDEEEEEEDEDGQEEDGVEEGNEEEEENEDEEGEGQDEPIEEEERGEDEEGDDDDVIVIDDEDDIMELEQPQQEIKRQGLKEKTTEIPLQNEATPRVETAKEKLQKAQAKAYYEWMAGIEQNKIEQTVVELDTDSVLKMVQMANQEIRQHPAKFYYWRPWLKFAVQKCMFQVEDVNNGWMVFNECKNFLKQFCSNYKDLIALMMRHVQVQH